MTSSNDDRAVSVFFYGSYINRDVLAEVDLAPERWSVARVAGFDIVIRPRANLVRSDRSIVYGVLANASHAELEKLYVEHAKGKLGERYLPEAVLVEVAAGGFEPALCYISHGMVPRTAEIAYIDRIAGPARQLGFPDWYIARIESFKP